MSAVFKSVSDSLRPTAEVLLDLWLDASAASERNPIGLKGEPSYRYFWSTWVQYLKTGKNGAQESAIAWFEVTPEDVHGFLNSGPTSRKRGANVSDITRRRYWRLLERIYDFALGRGWVEVNPAKGLVKAETPKQEDPLGAVVSPGVWEALQEILASPSDGDPVTLRNRALLACLTELGLMPMEARTLTISSVLYGLENGMQRPEALQIDGPGKNQRRRMVLPPLVVQSLQEWLAVRSRVAQNADVHALFCTNRGASSKSDKPGGQMTSVTLLLLVREFITRAAQAAGEPLPARLGPQILRNTRLTMWLNEGVPANEVVLRAGLKNAKGFAHLRPHLNREIRLQVANAGNEVQ